MGKSKTALRYSSVDEMPPGMRRLMAQQDQPPATAGYRPAPAAKAIAGAAAGGKVARGRVQHVAGEMNKTEAAYCAHLEQLQREGEIAWFRFEAVKLRLAKNTHLTVDFFVMRADGELEAHEVKGHWEEDARVKIKVAAAMYPFRFLAVQRGEGGTWKTEVFE
ncbi:hypothetical protein [[Pseudomonas] boreopolis]|uniref:DUF1064 domain-containing protein n=1 Tax=Xanthomonas boreopolis TaxID=86183 RepID=A0A919F7E8_9XANT|nr:hypothetical protein GCM10009090_16380 [[Pseudomonas] boreopolis]